MATFKIMEVFVHSKFYIVKIIKKVHKTQIVPFSLIIMKFHIKIIYGSSDARKSNKIAINDSLKTNYVAKFLITTQLISCQNSRPYKNNNHTSRPITARSQLTHRQNTSETNWQHLTTAHSEDNCSEDELHLAGQTSQHGAAFALL